MSRRQPHPSAQPVAAAPGESLDLTRARVLLLLHRLDPASAGCAACGRPSPCATSRDAAETLALAGAWNTLEVPGHFAPPSELLLGSPRSPDGATHPAAGSRGITSGGIRSLLWRLAVLGAARRRPGRR